jgi:uncharacterized lipoprotein YmbA
MLAAAFSVGLLAGCASAPSRFYTLDAPEPDPTVQSAPASVAVAAVTLPDLVDRPQLVVRRGAHEVSILETQRWGAPLRGEIARVIAANLSRELGGVPVAAYPQNAVASAKVRVSVDVQRFDSTPGEAAYVEALWSVRRVPGGEPASGRSVVRAPASGPGYDALVDAHSRALAVISRDIAAVVRSESARR